jgi:hypothetical protein
MTEPDDIIRQRLIDALQTAAPLAQRLHVTARQQTADAMALLNALERAVAYLQELRAENGGAR